MTHGAPDVIRRGTTVLAVTLGCAVLTWTAVALTGEDAEARPVALVPASCEYTLSDPAHRVSLPPTDPKTARRPYTVTLGTNMGNVVFESLGGSAPCATNSFVHLARNGYYRGSACHRVSTRQIFVLECGDPAGEGTADPGYYFKDENLMGATYKAGTVAMSKVVPGRNGSQFFISYADPQVRMPESWTPFGRVIRGLDVLKEIGAKGTRSGTPDGKPKDPVVIESVTVK
ncbi:peptidylprolyl isomerase [Streptomyces sp. NPDC019396]|uniref:peptidylprolyl isomerase n=1 Tax=Streptomyces sp. NPDC019396 TaxID=3154687 RepID=UPI0033F614AC